MGYPDLAMMTAEIGLRIGREHDDPAWRAQATYSWIQAFPPENAGLGARLTERAANEVQGQPDHGAQEVYGCLHLLSAFQAAIANEPDRANTHLDEAKDVAQSLGEPEPYAQLSAGFNGNWFGPTQVEYWRVAVAAELGDASEAIKVSRRVDLSVVPLPNRWVYYWTDFARALAAGGKNIDAMHALARAERSGPQHFRFNPIVRDLVSTLIERAKRRAVAGEMTVLATKLGIHPI